MVDLTVVILTKNEEKNLRKCVESFQGIAKRFVIVDSFSTDATENLCWQLNTELQRQGSSLDFYQNKWIDYATQFNWGLGHTNITTKWTMRIDADEELMEDLSKEINEKLDVLPDAINGVILRRRLIFMGKWIKHGGRYPEMLLRIFRTGKAICEQKIMDEHIILLEGRTTTFQCDLMDNNKKNLEWWTAKHNWYSDREVLDYNITFSNTPVQKTLLRNGVSTSQAKRKRIIKNSGYYRLPRFFRAHLYFIYRYYIRVGFLDGPEGRIFHFYRFLVDAKMYECEKMGTKIKMSGDLKA